MKNEIKTTIATILLSTVYGTSQAHTAFVVDATSVPFAGKNYVATISASHGCSDAGGNHYDTEIIEIDIPAGVSSVRPMDATWGTADVTTDEAGAVTMITWTRTIEPHAADTFLYQAGFRAKLPDTAFTTVAFTIRQKCHDADGLEVITAWEGASAGKLNLVPARSSGWNKYSSQTALDEAALKTFFSDAQIVWYGEAAYSANTVTTGIITDKLTTIPAGAEFWVKY